jgi:hypothetical protein
MRRLTRTIVVIFVLVVIAGFVYPAIPLNAGHSSTLHFCTQCGIAKRGREEWDRENVEPTVTSEIDSTPLSQWYDSHYPEPCGHEWCFGNSSTHRFFRWGAFSTSPRVSVTACGRPPRLIHLSDEERRNLEHRFEADPIACKEYLKSQLEPRFP